MTKPHSAFETKISKARGHGAAHHGVSHWWLQRVSAVALIPLTVWFLYSLITVMLSPEVLIVQRWFASPVNALLLSLLLGAMFFHAKLGFQVVIEDYIKCPYTKYTLLLANVFVSIGFAAIGILSIVKLHLL
jgi:succinate dehydrogenase / fumarate reductase membrane anchor subunit